MALEEQLATVVALAIQQATGPLAAKVAVLETRAGVPGPAGEKGDPGEPGPPGRDGQDGRVETVEQLEPVEITASVTDLLTHELAGVIQKAAPVRMQKRVIRDRHGKIDRVIEEPVKE